MSRVGLKPIIIPKETTVEINQSQITVTGPLGQLIINIRPEIKVKIDGEQLLVSRINESKLAKSLHGLTRSLINNLIIGVNQGYEKTLKVIGTGFKANLEGETLVLNVGFSHQVKIIPEPGIKFQVENNELIKISGIDKIKVGQVTAKIRSVRPPDHYKGKGIRYLDEQVKLKPGKAGKAGAAGGPAAVGSGTAGGGAK